MKKLFALLLALAMTTQLALPAWAEGTEPSAPAVQTEETTKPQTEEPTEAPTEATTEQPTEEPTEAPTEAPSEAPTEEPTEVQPEDPAEPPEEETSPAEAAETYRITFRRTPEDLALVVYPAAGDIDQAIDPEEDGSYLLATGEYGYLAAAEGYESIEGWFTVGRDKTIADLAIDISLQLVETKEAEVYVESGKCGANLTWSLSENGVLRISGTGDMYDYSFYSSSTSEKAPWSSNSTSIKKIFLEKGVTSIGTYAFYYLRNLQCVYLPATVETINVSSTCGPFNGCPGAAVIYCEMGEQPSGWKNGWNDDCSVEYGINSNDAQFWFSLNMDEEEVIIPDGITTILSYAFADNSNLKKVTIPDTVISIHEWAFENCSSLEMLYLPKSIASISTGSFWKTSQKIGIFCEIGSEQDGWEKNWNLNGSSPIHTYFGFSKEEYILLHGIDKTGTEITIPEGVTIIPAHFFEDLAEVKEIHLPESLQRIDNNAFSKCTGLRRIYIPRNVTVISAQDYRDSPFYRCDSKTRLYCGASAQMSGWDKYWSQYDYSESLDVYYGYTSKDVSFWESQDPEAESVVIPEGVTIVPQSFFDGRTNLREITFPESMKAIRKYAFRGCTNLRAVTMAEGIKVIEAYAFYGCTSLTSIQIPDSISKINSNTFYGCTALISVQIPMSVTQIGAAAFTGCTSLTSIQLPTSVSRIDEDAFSGCSSLTSIQLSFVTSIGARAFKNCTGLKEIDLKNATYIAQEAFYGCTSLKPVYIPNSVTGMGPSVFLKCNDDLAIFCAAESQPKGWNSQWNAKAPFTFDTYYNISVAEYEFWSQIDPDVTSITIPDTVSCIPKHISDRLHNVVTVHIPGTVRCIEEEAFFGCDNLTTVIIDYGVEKIGKNAFWWCTKLREVRIPGSVKLVSDGAFKECSALRSVTLEDGIEELGCELFEDSNNIPKLVIPASVKKIGYGLVPQNGSTRLEFKGTVRAWAAMLPYISAYCSDGCLIDGGTCGDLNVSVGENVTWFITKPKDKYVLTIFGNGAMGDNEDADRIGWAYYRDNIGEVVIEEGVTKIGECAFWGCVNLKKITLPDSLEWINQYAFSWCHSLRTIAIPKNVDTIGYQAFYDCYNLTSINFLHEADSKLEIFDEAFITDGRSAATTIRVRDTASVNPAIRNYDWKGSHRSASYGFVDCLPKVTNIEILADGKTPPTDIDMFERSTLVLTAMVEPAMAVQRVTWSSSAANVARVDADGVVTLVRPGKAVIKASSVDGSKVAAQVTLNVTYLDGSTKLTLTGDVPAQGLQPGQTARFTLRGSEEIAPENVIFTVPANMAAMGSVDETGLFTAGSKAGTVTVTAALRGDPLNRKASVRFKVLPLQAEEMALSAQLPEGFGTLTEQAGEPLLILPKADVTTNTTFPLTLLAKDYRGEAMTPGVKWSSSDTAIAAVDAKGNVTVKAGVSGQCAITAQATDMTKNSARFWISVRDYSPRLAESRLNLNTALAGGVSTALVESYGNTVEAVSIVNDDRFEAALEDNVLTLKASSDLPKGSYKLTLRAACADGRSYDYALEIKAAPALPKVTVKQAEKLNLFYRDSAAALTVTASGCTVTDLSLTGTEDFALVWTDGQPQIVRTATETAKPNTRATLQIWLEGYTQPVTRNLTVSAGTTAPKLKLSAASSSLNTALNPENLSAELWLLDSTKARLSLSGVSIREENGLAEISTHADSFTLTLQKPEKAKLTLLIQGDNWTQSVKLTHSVNVETKLPTLKSASAITLNSYFTQDSGKTEMILSQKNLVLQDVRFAPAARAGTAARTESDKLELTFDPEDNTVRASMADPENAAAAGNYSFTCIGVLADGTEIPGGTLKVTVAKTLPKARLSASAVRLNTVLAGEEQAEVTADLTGFSGCTLVGFRELDEAQYDGLDFADGKLTVRLADESAKSGTYKLTPIVRRDATGQLVTLPTSLTLKLTVYTSRKLGVSLTAKGKLDTLDPDSAVLYTVNKLTDCQGEITGLTLEGPDADRFQAELDTTGAKPQIRLTLREGETYATNVTYKFQFSLTVCGRQVLSPIQSLRVSQSGTKYTVPTGLALYQSQTADLCARITLTAPRGAKIAGVTLNEKTPQAFLDAIGGEGGFTADCIGSEANLTFTAAAPGKLKPGVYTVLLDILPEGNAENVKPTTLRLTVKVMK